MAIAVIAGLPPALLADDLPAARSTLAVEQSVADSNSSLRLLPSDSGNPPAPAPLARREAAPRPTPAAAFVAREAGQKPLFSHTRWEGPAAVVPPQPDLHWKGAFRTERRPPTVVDPAVVQTSGEMPLDTVRPVFLPTPAGPGLGVTPDSPTPEPPTTAPPPPVRIGPSTEPVPAPMSGQQLARQPDLTEKCSLPGDLKSIREITSDIGVKAEDRTGEKGLPPECSLGDTPLRPRHWHCTTFAWTAASTCHNPLYFEEEQLERYGHSWGTVKQSAVSAIKFFGTVPLLPYYMGVYPPNECIYDLGQYRPGSCAPYYLDPFPLSVRGALYEGTFLGLIPVAL